MTNLRNALLSVADAYTDEINMHGGKSLARVSTIVLNQGRFFQRLRDGKTCTLDSFEAVLEWFSSPANWPGGTIPPAAADMLAHFATPVPAAAE
ncbi:hypothetical protein [Sphingopyxis macrogoltabida]|nr:hypothetical protein [Sphingopyxis macrogoltabida]